MIKTLSVQIWKRVGWWVNVLLLFIKGAIFYLPYAFTNSQINKTSRTDFLSSH